MRVVLFMCRSSNAVESTTIPIGSISRHGRTENTSHQSAVVLTNVMSRVIRKTGTKRQVMSAVVFLAFLFLFCIVVSGESKTSRSVHLSVRLFSVCLLNQLTFELDYLCIWFMTIACLALKVSGRKMVVVIVVLAQLT